MIVYIANGNWRPIIDSDLHIYDDIGVVDHPTSIKGGYLVVVDEKLFFLAAIQLGLKFDVIDVHDHEMHGTYENIKLYDVLVVKDD